MAACDAAGTTTATPAAGATDGTPTGAAQSPTDSPLATTTTGAASSPTNQAIASASTAQVSLPAIATTPATSPATNAAASPTMAAVTQVSTPTQVAPFTPSVQRVTRADCCEFFHWTAGNKLYFYDKPGGGQAGTYVVDAVANAPEHLLTTLWGTFTPDLSQVVVAKPESGEQPGFGAAVTINSVNGLVLATLPDASPSLVMSANKHRFAYIRRDDQQDGPERPQIFTLWAGDIAQKTNAKQLGKFREVTNLQWLPDNTRVIFGGRDLANQRFGVWVVDTGSGAATQVENAKGVRDVRLSPDGTHITYYVAYQPDAAANGLWVGKSDGSERKKLPFVGIYAWAPDSAGIIYSPLTAANAQSVALWRYSLADSATTRLTDPAKTPLNFTEEPWQLAPDGKRIAYRDGTNAISVLQFAS